MLSTLNDPTSTPISPTAASTATMDRLLVDDINIPIRLDPTIPPISTPSSSHSHRPRDGLDGGTSQSNRTAPSQNSQSNLTATWTSHRPDVTNQRLLTSFRQRRQDMLQAMRYENEEQHSNRDGGLIIPVYNQVTNKPTPPFPNACSLMV